LRTGAETAAPAEVFEPSRGVNREAILERYRRAQGASEPAPGGSARGSSERPGTIAGRVPTGPSRRVATARDRLAARDPDVSPAIDPSRSTDPRISGARARYNAGRAAVSPGLTGAYQRDPARAGAYVAVGGAVTQACNVSIAVGLNYACGVPYDCWPGYWGWYGCYPYYSWCSPYYFGWCGWWWGGYYPYWGYWPYYWWRPYYDTYCYYYNSYPAYYGSVIYTVVEEPVVVEEEPVVVEEAPAEEVVGEGVIAGRPANPELDRLLKGSGADSLARASNHYLTLGDSAFRDNRFGDAVHFYAKAVEFAPTDGVLYLVLSDALFATGDYHYGAYALRKALELDPTLLDMVVDKRSFYTDGARFDQQLSVLEDYLRDHPADNDARLLLAANYLFSNRPRDAQSLLEEAGGAGVRADTAGQLVYEASLTR
jgi:hypothetical protein